MRPAETQRRPNPSNFLIPSLHPVSLGFSSHPSLQPLQLSVLSHTLTTQKKAAHYAKYMRHCSCSGVLRPLQAGLVETQLDPQPVIENVVVLDGTRQAKCSARDALSAAPQSSMRTHMPRPTKIPLRAPQYCLKYYKWKSARNKYCNKCEDKNVNQRRRLQDS